ncbi:MAG: YceI family protein [Rhodospirillaceae bacterium]|nr:YceI family protein [Rhodospirillaceae bacterium]MCA8931668.1 YceI family protein [Rhodospirillaceae bacterium]
MLRPSALAAALMLIAGPAAATDWSVDGDTSSLGFIGTQAGSEFTGRFEAFTADISFDPADLEAVSVRVVIDVASFDSGSQDRDETAMDGDWFDVETYPEAVFEVTGVEATGEGAYEAAATLTIKDQTHDVVLPFTLAIDGDTARMSGELTVDRRDYTLGTGDWATGELVGTDVTITVDLSAVRVPE